MRQICLLMLAVCSGCDSGSDTFAQVVHPSLSGGNLRGSWASTAYRVFFVGGTAALTPDGNPDAVCVNGARELWEYDGVTWKFLSTDFGDTAPVSVATTGCGSGKMKPGIAPGPKEVQQRQDQLWAVFGFSQQQFYVAGDRGLILRISSDGSVEKMVVASGTDDPNKITFHGLWGTGDGDIWAVGGLGASDPSQAPTARIYHYDGVQWSPVSIPNASGLLAVWGASATEVWAVGLNGTILRFDGVSWKADSSGTTDGLASVSGTDGSHVVAVGGTNAPVIVRFDGKSWSKVSTSLKGVPLLAVAALDATHYALSGADPTGGQSGYLVAGTLANPKMVMPVPPAVALHTISNFFALPKSTALPGGRDPQTQAFVAAGGNIFEQNRSIAYGTVVAVNAAMSSTFAARTSGAGGFATSPPPPSTSAPTGSTGW